MSPRPTLPPALGALVKESEKVSWGAAKKLIISGKVFVDGVCELNPGFRPSTDARIEIRHNAKRSRPSRKRIEIVFQDTHLSVIEKPRGISSVPYHEDERDTAMDLLRDAWRARGENAQAPIHVVHRIDKETSGLMVFARTKKGELGLSLQLREHTMHRRYWCVVQGHMQSQRIESLFIRDRGDGLRGSNRHDQKGKRSITHIKLLKNLGSVSLCEVRLETGRTHQIRIHCSEARHPIVGDKVYTRDFRNAEKHVVPCSRLLLHAKELGFSHPTSGEQLHFESELPSSFRQAMNSLTQP